MAMKNTVSENTPSKLKNVCGKNKEDYARIRIPLGTSEFKTGIPGFVIGAVNPKNSCIFSNSKEKTNLKLSLSSTDDKNIKSFGHVENEGSKGDINRKFSSRNELSRNLGCDGDVKHNYSKRVYLCSSGANGDILKPLDDNFTKYLENKSNWAESTSMSKHEELVESRDIENSVDSTSEKKTDFLSIFTNLVNNWKGKSISTDKKDKTCTVNNNARETTVMVENIGKSEEITKNDINATRRCGPLIATSKFKFGQEELQASCNSTLICDENDKFHTSESSDCLISSKLVYETDTSEEEMTINLNDIETKIYYGELIKNTDSECSKTVQNENTDSSSNEKTITDEDLKIAENKSCISEKEENKQRTENNTQNKEVIEKNEKDEVVCHLIEIEKKLTWKKNISVANMKLCRPTNLPLAKLDSSLKKNTSFIKKLKNFTSSQFECLLKDVHTLNLSKYLSEVAAGVVNAKLKIVDILPAVELCNELHQIYSDFSTLLFNSFQKYLSTKDEDEMASCRKLNVDLKFYVELMNIGIFNREEAFPLVITVLTMAIHNDKTEYNNITLITSFYRHCKDGYAISRKIRNLAEKYNVKLPSCCLLLPEEETKVKALLNDYYSALVQQVIKMHHEVKKFQRQNTRILQLRGEVSRERKDKFEAMKLLKDRLWLGVNGLGAVLDEVIPDLIDANPDNNELTGDDNTGVDEQVWEDKDEQQFYENITDLQEFVPSVTVKSHPHENEKPDLKTIESDENILEENIDKLIGTESVTIESDANVKKSMKDFLSLLPTAMNCQMTDQLVIEFVTSLNNKSNRKKLLSALYHVPRTRTDLLPFYARFVATLYPFIPEISVELSKLLKYEFKYHICKKDQINIESKLKVVRYIGELVKFKLYSKFECLYCLKLLLRDFSHHHIEMFCTLLETCGRYLYRNSCSHQQIKDYLEQMMRKKFVTVLDPRYSTMIDNAFYFVVPPTQSPTERKEKLSPIKEFIKKILYQDLSRSNIENILQLMCKMDWEDSDLTEFAIDCLTKAYNVKYMSIAFLASIVSGITCEIDSVGILIVDGVMEDIRLGMEINMPKFNQRRMAMVKYIGELYKYRVAESNEIFQVLYSLISFGVTLNCSSPSYLDPPNNLFRIRLCCTLLDNCGKYFTTGNSSKKLNYFLTYFQRYFLFKYEDKFWNEVDNRFPVRMEHLYKDTVTNLCPDLKFFSSFQEANQAVHDIEIKFANKILRYRPWLIYVRQWFTDTPTEHNGRRKRLNFGRVE
ncbi:hypothetical protein L9F63_007445 [Diploptera punctata]|uniref:MIF4G domain-containing protein n=1 Tax=Diploptera punctata TaxID=6984 RepID=A0AAD7Z8F9_DIPPU|nr:hypothetical protein L9F63_007445 [Diploptera punctata]